MMKELSFLYNCLLCVSLVNLDEFHMISLKGLVLPSDLMSMSLEKISKIKLASLSSSIILESCLC